MCRKETAITELTVFTFSSRKRILLRKSRYARMLEPTAKSAWKRQTKRSNFSESSWGRSLMRVTRSQSGLDTERKAWNISICYFVSLEGVLFQYQWYEIVESFTCLNLLGNKMTNGKVLMTQKRRRTVLGIGFNTATYQDRLLAFYVFYDTDNKSPIAFL